MIIGIEYYTFIQLLLMAAGIPLFILWLIWVMWIPKPAKAYIYAKLLRKIVDIEANDLGILNFKIGKVGGAGIFETRKEEVEFVPRNPEPWVNKRFSADKIGTVISYSGKAVCVNPETLAVLEVNQLLHALKLLKNEGKLDTSVLPENLRKSLENQFLNIEDTEIHVRSGKRQKRKALKRMQAILLDPRILKTYVSKMISPAQIQYMLKKAYEKGYRDGQRPMYARLIPILIVMVLIALIFITLFFGKR